MDEVFDDFDARLPVSSESGAEVEVCSLMTTVTFLIITSAGFGQSITWFDAEDEKQCPPGYKLPFRRALLDALGGIFVYAVTPSWIHKLPSALVPSSMARVSLAFTELRKHLLAMVEDARSADAKEGVGADLFKRLIEANKDSDGEKLSDDELISNIFIFLLAGHETSAHTLAFALVLLALYPEVQEELRAEALRVWPTGTPTSEMSYSDHYPRLIYSKAVFRETLRHFPPVPRLWKIVQQEAALPYSSLDGRTRGEFVAPSDSVVILDIRAIQMNPLYWGEDAEDFRPSRFIDTEGHRWPREAFYPFSAGPRACLGTHFAMAESVCILSRIAAHYELLPPPELRGRPLKEQLARLLTYDVGTTISPNNARVVFRKR
ncbi:cytochrome P450 [Auricularia subglabra TFB-10046 SS5]|nr:cytochrome P450 [Auricularia subglabra TFB-10046 SS5]